MITKKNPDSCLRHHNSSDNYLRTEPNFSYRVRKKKLNMEIQFKSESWVLRSYIIKISFLDMRFKIELWIFKYEKYPIVI